jgi:hypothetical protein
LGYERGNPPPVDLVLVVAKTGQDHVDQQVHHGVCGLQGFHDRRAFDQDNIGDLGRCNIGWAGASSIIAITPKTSPVPIWAKTTYSPSQSLDTPNYAAFNEVGVVASVSYEED